MQVVLIHWKHTVPLIPALWKEFSLINYNVFFKCYRVRQSFFLFEKAKIVCSKTFLPHFFLFCICKIYIFSVLYVVMRRLLLISVVVHFYILQHREMWNISRGNSSRCLIVIKTLRKLKQKIELKDMKAGTLVARGFLVVANFSIGLCEVCGKRWNRYATLPRVARSLAASKVHAP